LTPIPARTIDPFAPAEQRRFRERSAAERVNSQLHDNYGARFCPGARGGQGDDPSEFGVIALTATQLYPLVI